jgi:peptide methionine sulfoxide reductase MsrA
MPAPHTLIAFFLAASIWLAAIPCNAHSDAPNEHTRKRRKRPCYAGGCFWCLRRPMEEHPRACSRQCPAIPSPYPGPRLRFRVHGPDPATGGRARHRHDPATISYEDIVRGPSCATIDPHGPGHSSRTATRHTKPPSFNDINAQKQASEAVMAELSRIGPLRKGPWPWPLRRRPEFFHGRGLPPVLST